MFPAAHFFGGSYRYISGLNVVWPQRRRDIEAKHWPLCRDVEANDMIWYDIVVIWLWGQIERQWQWQIHLKNTFKEQSLRLLAFETFDQSDEKTWPDQQKDNDEDKYKYKDNDKDNVKYI